jgi:hypothetical protein
MTLLKIVRRLKIYRHTKCHGPTLHPPQKFERQPFWNGWTCGVKYGVVVAYTEFHKMYRLVQEL